MHDRHPLPLQQHPRFATALSAVGATVSATHLPQADDIQIVQRFGLHFATRGPIFDPKAGLDQRIAALRQAGLHLLNAETPDPALRGAGFRQTHTGAFVAEMILDAGIIGRLHPKWRATWRKAGEMTLKPAPFTPHDHGWLLQADHLQQRKAGYRALPHALIRAFAATAPDAATVYTAEIDDAPIAAMLFLRHAPVVTYHLGWTSEHGRLCGAHHKILIAAAHDHAAKGYRRLDLGLVDTHNSPGLARFKIGTGALIRQLGGTWIRLPGLCEARSRLASGRIGR
ncbi:GNAT family N-acetyltransferase [Yoonia vestfoldensis]|uniref:GNAT family N-acetyltransferase n=1 Tax=Yoonia vestfoldensis TaxID=245188 RepID=UPI0003814B9B|nr:GNAT family N-acetyltransferase [Yoonia vestfoldensis]